MTNEPVCGNTRPTFDAAHACWLAASVLTAHEIAQHLAEDNDTQKYVQYVLDLSRPHALELHDMMELAWRKTA